MVSETGDLRHYRAHYDATVMPRVDHPVWKKHFWMFVRTLCFCSLGDLPRNFLCENSRKESVGVSYIEWAYL